MKVSTWIAVTGLALPLLAGGGAVAVDVNRVPSELPQIEVYGASAYGLLYRTRTTVHAQFPEQTWVKPAGRAPYRVDNRFVRLAGDKIYSGTYTAPTMTYQVIGTPATRTCDASPQPAGEPTSFGWISADGDRVEAGATGCRVTARYPNLGGGKVGAADALGYVVATETHSGPAGQLRLTYHSYADPARPRVIADGGRNRYVVGMALSGPVVTWAQYDYDSGRPGGSSYVVRSSTDGSAPAVVTLLDRPVQHTAILGGATGWAGCADNSPGPCGGGTLLADGTRVERPGTRTVAGDGTWFVFDSYGADPGIEAAALLGGGTPVTRIVTIGLLPPTSYAVSIAAGGIAYVDSQGPAQSVSRRLLGPAPGPQVRLTDRTPEKLVARDGRRTAYLDTGYDLWLVTDDGVRTRVFDSVDEVARVSFAGGLTLSGTRLLWTRAKYTGIFCDPAPICGPAYHDLTYMLYDLRTGTSTELPYQVSAAKVALWGSYLVYQDGQGAIRRRDLSSGKVLLVKAAGSAPLRSLAVHGDHVGWATCVSGPTSNCSPSVIGYRNLATLAPAVQLTSSETTRVRLSGGHLGYDSYSPHPVAEAIGTLKVLRLGTRVTGTIGAIAIAHSTTFDIHDQTLAWVGPDEVVRTAANSAFVDPPRYLGNALGSSTMPVGGSWAPEFSLSKALPVCGVTIRRGTAIVRSLGCATGVGSARVVWNGRDAAGRLLPRGSYSWTLGGHDADGRLRWWNGSTTPIRGTITIR